MTRSGKAKETREKIACDVREVSPTDKEKESTSCYVREVTRSDETLVPLSPVVLFPCQVVFSIS